MDRDYNNRMEGYWGLRSNRDDWKMRNGASQNWLGGGKKIKLDDKVDDEWERDSSRNLSRDEKRVCAEW